VAPDIHLDKKGTSKFCVLQILFRVTLTLPTPDHEMEHCNLQAPSFTCPPTMTTDYANRRFAILRINPSFDDVTLDMTMSQTIKSFTCQINGLELW
jgi:hypothetical protein